MKAFQIFFRYWLPALLWGGFIIFLSTRPDLRTELSPFWDLVLRKIGHIGIYFIMTLLLARIGLRGAEKQEEKLAGIFVAGLGSLVLAFLDENIQAATPGRSGSLRDVGFDLVGILLAVSLLFQYKERNKRVLSNK